MCSSDLRETETGKKKIDGKKRGRDSLKMIKSIMKERVLEKDLHHKIKNYKKSIVENLTMKISIKKDAVKCFRKYDNNKF